MSDQFIKLGLAVRSGMQAQRGLTSGPSFVVVPYPVSGLEPPAVRQKAFDAGPEVAQEIVFRLESRSTEEHQ